MSRPFLNDETQSWGVGPVTLDIEMARRHGWSDATILQAVNELGAISRRFAEESHWAGPVKNCPCATCDFRTPVEELFEESERLARARWESFAEKKPLEGETHGRNQ